MAFDDELSFSFFLKPSNTAAKGEEVELGLLDLWLSDPIGELEPTDRGLLELSEDPDFFEEKKSFVFLNTISDFDFDFDFAQTSAVSNKKKRPQL